MDHACDVDPIGGRGCRKSHRRFVGLSYTIRSRFSLSKVSSDWNKRVGRGTLVKFPIGAAAQYNEGVRDAIKQQPFSFGYLESTYAFEAHLPSGRVLNSTGKFVQADSGSITAAAAATATNMPADLRASITNSNDEDAYPISSFTWILVPEHIEDRARREAIVGFLKWVLADGQQFAQPSTTRLCREMSPAALERLWIVSNEINGTQPADHHSVDRNRVPLRWNRCLDGVGESPATAPQHLLIG
jgi:hypothetical protein